MERLFILLGSFISAISSHIFRILIALILLWIGFKIIKKLTKIQFKLLDRNGIDGTVSNYLNHISQISLKVILIINIIRLYWNLSSYACSSVRRINLSNWSFSKRKPCKYCWWRSYTII